MAASDQDSVGQDLIGVVGLGIMGGAAARLLVQAGRAVVGFDLDPARCDEAAGHGVALAADLADLARQAPVILTSLPSAAAVRATAKGIADAGVEARVVVEMSTLSLADKQAFAETLAAAGHRPVDAPLSGTGAQMQTGDVVVYASGAPDAVAATLPVVSGFARQAHDLGAFGNGTRMKLVANLLVAIHNVAAAEAMVLGVKAGLDPDQIVRLIGAGAGTSRMFEMRAPLMAAGRYEPPTMRIATWKKDMDVIGAFAAELGVAAPLFGVCGELYEEALAAGLGPLDTAAVVRLIEERSGLARATEGAAG